MSIYHCSIKIISRSGGRSAVASAAYRSGERLYNDETGIIHDFSHKGGVIMNEIILPVNAPVRYMNREILWNEVQQIEKRNDAQFAREVEVALPVEMSRDEQIECVRKYIMENFVEKGMIADWALHDKGDGNPHAHILLTVRGIDENETWKQKQKTVFANARDNNGRAIYNPDLPVYDPKNKEETSKYRIPQLDENGEQKYRKREGKGCEYLWEKISIPENDWNDKTNAEIWRASWAKHCNEYLDEKHQIDHRSYERQGIEYEPTIHEGVTARKMESKGKVSDRCKMNRETRKRNSFLKEMKELAVAFTNLITEKARDLLGRFKEFAGSFGHSRSSRTDDERTRRTTKRDRKNTDGKTRTRGESGRNTEIKRGLDETKQFSESTDREIAEIEQRVAELTQLTMQKEADRDERFRKLIERRQSSGDVRGTTAADREPASTDIAAAKDDIESFLRELDTKERTSEEKRDDKITERADRETQYQRSRIEEERRIKERERDSSPKRI